MKKSIKKLFAFVLCLCIAFSCASVAFAADTQSEKCPIVFIPGFGQSETKVYDENGEYLGNVASFDLPGLNDVSGIIKQLLSPVVLSSITRSDKALSETVSSIMYDLFKPFALNDDGSYVYNRVVRRFNVPYSQLSEDDKTYVYNRVSLNSLEGYDDVRYFYTYDSFGSIKTAADGLHDYIHNVVLAQTGAEKIDLIPISQGGTVFIEYLDLYPEDAKYIRKVINMIPAFDGSEIVGDIVCDNVTIYDIDKLHEELLPALIGENDTAYMISCALRLALSSETLEKVLRCALDTAKDILITKSSMMWALCPADDYAAAKNTLLSDEKYSAVRAETERYDRARTAFPENLKKLMESGVTVHTIACYDEKYIVGDLFESADHNSDGLLCVSSPSLGATTSKLGETLGSDYVSPKTYCSNASHNHLSPDGMIDASTGCFPENTWYFKGVAHENVNHREDIKDFAARLITDDSITDVHSCPGYTQFIDPTELIASKVENNDGTVSYYDADGNYMYQEKISDDTDSSFSFWKIPYKMFNICFRILHKLGLSV